MENVKRLLRPAPLTMLALIVLLAIGAARDAAPTQVAAGDPNLAACETGFRVEAFVCAFTGDHGKSRVDMPNPVDQLRG